MNWSLLCHVLGHQFSAWRTTRAAWPAGGPLDPVHRMRTCKRCGKSEHRPLMRKVRAATSADTVQGASK